MKLYFLALVPPLAIEGNLKALKEELRIKYGLKHALKLPAHITLQKPFWLKEEQEGDLIRILTSVALDQEKFSVELKDFGAFPPHAIYVKVLESRDLHQLFRKLQERLSTVLPDEKLMGSREFRPHATIAARDLKREDFQMVWKEYRNREFSLSWEVRELILFKHDGKVWHTHTVLGF